MSAAEENNNSSVGSTGAASRPETPEVLRGEKLDVELDVRWAENGTSDYAWLCRFQNLKISEKTASIILSLTSDNFRPDIEALLQGLPMPCIY